MKVLKSLTYSLKNRKKKHLNYIFIYFLEINLLTSYSLTISVCESDLK